MIIHTFTAGNFRAEIYDDNKVKVFKNDLLIDYPGPWGDVEGAKQWAEAIIGHYASQEA